MERAGNSSSATSAAFLAQLRAHHAGPLIIGWANRPVHGGEAMRAYLETPASDMPICRLPAYSPDFNADEAIWAWVREDVTANTCLGTKAAVQEQVGLTREEVEIERHPLSADAAANLEIGEQTIRVPLMAEEAIVEKRVVPIEEVVVRKEAHTEERLVEGDVRRERLDESGLNQQRNLSGGSAGMSGAGTSGAGSRGEGLLDRAKDKLDDLKDRVDGNPASRPGPDATDRR
jgi:uncharacterized protein (TIGR02271 family)